MATRQLGTVVQYLRRLVVERAATEQSDGELLGRFHERQEADAFAALVRRHGPMVLSVCRRLLGDVHHAEDAFQATFLVLVRKSGSIRKRQSLGSWLHGVAYRIAVRARIDATQRRLQAMDPVHEPATQDDDQAAWRDLRRVLDEELYELPEKYRQPLVLCYLEGKTNEEAARILGWTKGTVSGRLARARDLLRSRLVRRGLTLAACGLAILETELSATAAVPLALELSTTQLATLVAAGDLAAAGAVGVLTEGVIQSMASSKIKIAAAFLTVLGILGSGAGLVGYQAFAQPGDRVNEQPEPVKAAGAAEDFQPAITLQGPKGDTYALAVSPDGRLIASGGVDAAVRLWSLRDGQVQSMLHGHNGPIHDLAFSPDGRRLASLAGDQMIRIWDTERVAQILVLQHPTEALHRLAFAPDGKTLAAAASSDRTSSFLLLDVETGKLLRRLQGPKARLLHLAFSPDGKVLITGESDGPIRQWDVSTGKEVRTFQPQGEVWAMAVSPDGKVIATAGDQRVMLLEPITGKLFSTFQGDGLAATVHALAFSPDGKILAVARKDGTIDLLEVPTGKRLEKLQTRVVAPQALTFTPDGQKLVTSGPDGAIRVWKTDKDRKSVKASDVLARINSARMPTRLQALIVELARSQRSDDQLVEAFCLATLSRLPTETERRFMADHLAKQKDRRQEALADLVWALMNTKEFDAHISELNKSGWGHPVIRDPNAAAPKK